MAGERLAGAYGMLAWQSGEDGDRLAVGWCQFGPISAYPRAQVIRDRYPDLPDSPAPWVVTCLQVVRNPAGSRGGRRGAARCRLPGAGSARHHRRRGLPRGASPMRGCRRRGRHRSTSGQASPGWPARIDSRSIAASWRARAPKSAGATCWPHTAARGAGDDWPLPLPKGPSEEDLFRLPRKAEAPEPVRRRRIGARRRPLGASRRHRRW